MILRPIVSHEQHPPSSSHFVDHPRQPCGRTIGYLMKQCSRQHSERARHPISDHLFRPDRWGRRSDIRTRSPGGNSAHPSAAIRSRVWASTPDPLLSLGVLITGETTRRTGTELVWYRHASCHRSLHHYSRFIGGRWRSGKSHRLARQPGMAASAPRSGWPGTRGTGPLPIRCACRRVRPDHHCHREGQSRRRRRNGSQRRLCCRCPPLRGERRRAGSASSARGRARCADPVSRDQPRSTGDDDGLDF